MVGGTYSNVNKNDALLLATSLTDRLAFQWRLPHLPLPARSTKRACLRHEAGTAMLDAGEQDHR